VDLPVQRPTTSLGSPASRSPTREIGVRPPGPYPAARADDRRPTLALSAWAQYVLDDYATAAR